MESQISDLTDQSGGVDRITDQKIERQNDIEETSRRLLSVRTEIEENTILSKKIQSQLLDLQQRIDEMDEIDEVEMKNNTQEQLKFEINRLEKRRNEIGEKISDLKHRRFRINDELKMTKRKCETAEMKR